MLAPMKRISLWIATVAAALVAVGVFVQVYLITSYIAGAGEDALDAHGFLGFAIIHPLELFVFLASLGAWWGAWRWVGLSFFLIVLGTVQIFLVPPDDRTNGWVHGLHGLFALFVMILAAVIFQHGKRQLRRGSASPAGAAPPQPLP
jgi:hypothetical protein